MARISRIMTARLLVSSHRNGMSWREGNKWSMTWGIVSPMMTQNAIMPPKALQRVSSATLGRSKCNINIQEPLGQRYGHEPRLPKAVLYCRLERVGPAELRVDDNQADGPVDDDGEANEQDGARQEAGVPEGVGLADDAGTAARVSRCSLVMCPVFSHMMLFAMFMKELRMPLRGLALSRWSSGSKSAATVTLGASMPVSRGSLCTLSRPSSPCSSI